MSFPPTEYAWKQWNIIVSHLVYSQIGSLIIESAKKRDSGNYSCSPSNSPPVTVTLHIINGKCIIKFIPSLWGYSQVPNCIISLWQMICGIFKYYSHFALHEVHLNISHFLEKYYTSTCCYLTIYAWCLWEKRHSWNLISEEQCQ